MNRLDTASILHLDNMSIYSKTSSSPADSAYGASPAMKWEALDDLPDLVFNDQWRFQIYPADVEPVSHMYKSHLLSPEMPSTSLPPWHIYHQEPQPSLLFQETLSNLIELEELEAEISDDEGDSDLDSVFTLSPTLSRAEPEPGPTVVRSAPKAIPRKVFKPHHKGTSRRRESSNGKCFPCDMCSSTFSRNHDLKRFATGI
ncbi:hypothetical protein HDU91_007481 [Kappamyces sp. JEL0680]|nr:hypothetical protein HDU91_007481 [Kappamyces sp. JEL0680]